MECKLNDLPRVVIAYWTILPPLPPDKDKISEIFGSEKEIDKYQ